jgi:hypothetical protein
MRIIITEAQYKNIFENEEDVYSNVIRLLLDTDTTNKEIALMQIESQGLNLSKIVDLLLESNDIYDIESFKDFLEQKNDLYVFFPKDVFKINFSEDGKDLFIHSKVKTYFKTIFDDFDSKEEFYEFVENVYYKLKDSLQKHLQIEINRTFK